MFPVVGAAAKLPQSPGIGTANGELFCWMTFATAADVALLTVVP
jgi:hypothetical protein